MQLTSIHMAGSHFDSGIGLSSKMEPTLTLNCLRQFLHCQMRREATKEFRFDPQATVPEAEVRALVLKYRQKEEAVRSQMLRGTTELEALGPAAAERLTALRERIELLVAKTAQAEAEARAFR